MPDKGALLRSRINTVWQSLGSGRQQRQFAPNIEYFARTPDPKAPNGNAGNAKTRMRNGYAVIDLGHDGGCTEKFYEVDTDTPVWSRSWRAGELA